MALVGVYLTRGVLPTLIDMVDVLRTTAWKRRCKSEDSDPGVYFADVGKMLAEVNSALATATVRPEPDLGGRRAGVNDNGCRRC
ncbi:MAG: hypothetical protein M3256_19865 [Actinomycetota bacterium]|nr:hypothetical protein [Actinomycetota bacterium]